MKIKLLFLVLSIAQFTIGQTPPVPVYSHDFTGTLIAPGFTTTTGTWLTIDRNNTSQSAALLDPGHGLLYLDISDHKTELMQEGSISLWFRYGGTGTSAFGSDKPLVFWSNGNASYSEGVVLSTTSYANIKVISYQDNTAGGSNVGSPSVTTNITNSWHHFAVSWKFGTDGFIKGYIDGEKVASRDHDFEMPSGASDRIVFTGFNASHPSSLHGRIDEIKVFTEALTDEQIEYLYDPNICYVNIPDANFQDALLNHNPAIDTNGDGKIRCSEALAFTGTLSVNNKDIADLTGIEAFTRITYLNCRNNQLTSLDVSANTRLQSLLCDANQLTNLDVTINTDLTDIMCSDNRLTSLDVSTNTALKFLFLNDNQLTSLDISANAELLQLKANNNQLTSLNVANGNNTNFSRMETYNNPDLTCIKVDNAAYSNANWIDGLFQKPEGVSYSENCGTLSVYELETINPISIYPNPTSGTAYLNELSDVQIFDTSGRLILEQNNTTTIDLSNQESGVYLLKVKNNLGVIRIIKE